jgi:hypothetical protein
MRGDIPASVTDYNAYVNIYPVSFPVAVTGADLVGIATGKACYHYAADAIFRVSISGGNLRYAKVLISDKLNGWATWTTIAAVTSLAQPFIVSVGSYLYIAWKKSATEIQYVRSTDNGVSWSAAATLISGTTLTLDAQVDRVGFLYRDGATIKLLPWDYAGSTWLTAKTITPPAGTFYYCAGTYINNGIQLAFRIGLTGGDIIWLSHWKGNTATDFTNGSWVSRVWFQAAGLLGTLGACNGFMTYGFTGVNVLVRFIDRNLVQYGAAQVQEGLPIYIGGNTLYIFENGQYSETPNPDGVRVDVLSYSLTATTLEVEIYPSPDAFQAELYLMRGQRDDEYQSNVYTVREWRVDERGVGTLKAAAGKALLDVYFPDGLNVSASYAEALENICAVVGMRANTTDFSLAALSPYIENRSFGTLSAAVSALCGRRMGIYQHHTSIVFDDALSTALDKSLGAVVQPIVKVTRYKIDSANFIGMSLGVPFVSGEYIGSYVPFIPSLITLGTVFSPDDPTLVRTVANLRTVGNISVEVDMIIEEGDVISYGTDLIRVSSVREVLVPGRERAWFMYISGEIVGAVAINYLLLDENQGYLLLDEGLGKVLLD